MQIPTSWQTLLGATCQNPYFAQLRQRVREAYDRTTVYPPEQELFACFEALPPEQVRVVILGQDPYHEPGQAHGLAFSVPRGMTLPPSLVNILKELESDLGIHYAPEDQGRGSMSDVDNGDDNDGNNDAKVGILEPWTRQGVLLLNTVLTVRAHQAASHRGRGWEQFTDRVIELLAEREKPMVFVLWGAHAQAKKELILKAQSGTHHLMIEAPHPSPLSAYRGFFGGCYFSRCNYFLVDNGIDPIDWSLSTTHHLG